MKRVVFAFLLFILTTSVSAGTQFVPVMSGRIGDRLYRTTLELRAHVADQCTFQLRPLGGRKFEAVQKIEPEHPVVLSDFGAEFRVSSALRVFCTADVEVLSRIQESTDGGTTFSRGVFFSAPAREPLASGDSAVVPVHGAMNIAEVSGRAVHVELSCYSARLNGVRDGEYDLAPHEQHLIEFTEEDVGAVEATISVSGEGNVLVSTQPVTLQLANRVMSSESLAQQVIASQASISPQQAAALAAIRDVVAAPFKAAPFQDPDTGLIYMRDRWYDPRTGTFLTPDPQAYGDSSNLYAYCGGDPVNCSDPTGNAAHVSRSGTIIGIRPDGSRYTITRAEGLKDPKRVLSILESDADLGFADQEDILTQAGLPIPFSSACAPGESCISSKTPNKRAFTHARKGGGWGYTQGVLMASANMLTSPGAALTRDEAYVGFEPKTREQQFSANATNLTAAVLGTTAAIKQVAGVRSPLRAVADDPTILADPVMLRYSQTTAGGKGRADAIRASMLANGWQGAAIDAVMTADGIVVLDNTRPAVALELGMQDIPVRVHIPDEPLPPEMLSWTWNKSGQTAKTWGEALKLRAAAQDPALGPTGRPTPPTLMYRKK